MYLEILTPKAALFSDEILVVKLPGAKGSFEILKNHAPIISSLVKGVVEGKDVAGRAFKFEVDGGVVECKDNKIIVLATEVSKL